MKAKKVLAALHGVESFDPDTHKDLRQDLTRLLIGQKEPVSRLPVLVTTLHANREGFQHIQLRPRRLRDASKVDMRTDLFGTVYNSPIFTCPASGEKFLDPDGELAVARATKARGTMQTLSTSTSTIGVRCGAWASGEEARN